MSKHIEGTQKCRDAARQRQTATDKQTQADTDNTENSELLKACIDRRSHTEADRDTDNTETTQRSTKSYRGALLSAYFAGPWFQSFVGRIGG
eukprot:COSAG06_NODE_186_length_20792_cov_1041.487443_14_plen_92_part_00